MPTERLSMRLIRDVLRLKYETGLSERAISATLGISKGAIGSYLSRTRAAGLSWPLPPELGDAALERVLFPGQRADGEGSRPVPDWAEVERELRRRGVTRALLWQEHRARHPDGFGYSWFCEAYDEWKCRLSPTMRQSHVAGEKVFVDFAGDTIGLTDPGTGTVWQARLFVATMGASNLIFAEARASEGLADWLGAHVNLFAALGGVPKFVVCDNLKSAVISPDRHEPGLNRSYLELAEHYGTAVLPARPGKPRDKAKVEQSVLIAERWILARLRNARFFSLAELNAAIAALTAELNARTMRGFGASRAELFAALDAPALGELPAQPYSFATWLRRRPGPDYHVEVDGHWYSVPFRLIGQVLDVRAAAATVEVFHRGERVASHPRAPHRRGHSTIPEHMPSAHRRHAQWTPARLLQEAAGIGPAAVALCEAIMTARPHPEQGFRTCLGILALARTYGPARLEAACARGGSIRARSVASVRSILQNGLDRAFQEDAADRRAPPSHGNIRGGGYFH
jgi:transposase